MYSLNTAWLNKAERRRLDGFQARCLRIILHIPPAFLTRVPNSKVLEQAGQKQYSAQLLQQQMLLFGKIGRAPDADFLRQLTFQPGTVLSAVDACPRRRGRPKHEWAKCLHEALVAHLGPEHTWAQRLRDPIEWRSISAHIAHHDDEPDRQ
jgi:hypothetical protein